MVMRLIPNISLLLLLSIVQTHQVGRHVTHARARHRILFGGGERRYGRQNDETPISTANRGLFEDFPEGWFGPPSSMEGYYLKSPHTDGADCERAQRDARHWAQRRDCRF
jgi:hypothetical protein